MPVKVGGPTDVEQAVLDEDRQPSAGKVDARSTVVTPPTAHDAVQADVGHLDVDFEKGSHIVAVSHGGPDRGLVGWHSDFVDSAK